MSVEIAFDLYPANDPAGKLSTTLQAARLVRLTVGDQLSDAEFWPSLYGPGKGFIEIHGDHADTQHIQRRGWVAVYRIDDGPERPLGGFFLEEGDFIALAKEEQRGRKLRFQGEGGKRYFERFVLDEEIHAPGGVARGSHNIPGKWTWNDIAPGGILTRLIEEGQNAPELPYAAFGVNFTRDVDSNGDAWIESGDYQVDIGTRGDQVLIDQIERGLIVEVDEELEVFAYRDISDFRTDRTSTTFSAGKVRFEAGINIGNDLPKRIASKRERTHVLLRGKSGNYVMVDTDTDGNPLPGETFYDFLKNDVTSSVGTLNRIGQVHLTRLRTTSDQCKVRHLFGPGGTDGELGYDPGPDGDYWLGDLVTVHTGNAEHDYDEQPIEVAAIRYCLDKGNWIAEVDLGAKYTDSRSAEGAAATAISSIIQQVIVGDQLCEADQVIDSPIDPIGYIEVTGGHIDAGDWPPGVAAGDLVVIEATNVGLAAIPAAGGGSGWTNLGSGATTNDGPGDDVGFRMITRVLSAGDLVDMTGWTIGSTERIVGGVYRNVASVAGLAGDSISTGSSTLFEVPPVTLSVGDGTSRVVAGGHANIGHPPLSMTGLTRRALVPLTSQGAAAWYDTGLVSSWAGANGAITASAWQCHALELVSGGGSDTFLGDGRVELVGTSLKRKRCDDTEHWHEPGSGSPTVNDDIDAGFRIGTLWINDDGEAWFASSVAAGAADWIAISGGGGGAPDDATYLVTAAHAGLSAEVVVGASPGGELGGTWAAPTVDATHSGSTHSAATDTHIADAADAHDASAISFVPNGSIAATDVQAAIQEVRDEAAGGGAPSTVDYLVGTADAGLSNEIAVGTTPGGELGGTWASPTVDATHSGSAHHAEDHDHDGSPTQKLLQANSHQTPDTDVGPTSLHHTLGTGANQSAAGNHAHAGEENVYSIGGSDSAISNTDGSAKASHNVTGLVGLNSIRVDGWFTIHNNSGAGRNYILTLDFDGRFDIELQTGSLASSATLMHLGRIYGVLDVRNSALAYAVVMLDMQLIAGLASGADTTVAATHLSAKGWGTSVQDLTGTTAVDLFCRADAATATQTFRLHNFTARKFG